MEFGKEIYKEYDILGEKVNICIGHETRQSDAYYEAEKRGDGFAMQMLYEGDGMFSFKSIARMIEIETKSIAHRKEMERLSNLTEEQHEIEIAWEMGIPLHELRKM